MKKSKLKGVFESRKDMLAERDVLVAAFLEAGGKIKVYPAQKVPD